MEIVIDISEKNYMSCQTSEYARKSIYFDLVDSIRRSTILTKGHGRLIDVDRLDDTINRLNSNGNTQITRYEYKIIDNVISEMPTIIKADKENN